MYEDIARQALNLLSCRLIWLLANENDVLVTRAIATDLGDTTAQQFLQMVQIYHPEGYFPLKSRNNPLADVLLTATPIMNMHASRLANRAGGKPFSPALIDFGFYFVTVLPLIRGDTHLGVLMLGHSDEHFLESENGPLLIEMLQQQAVVAIEKDQLESELLARDAQIIAERQFRKLIMETVGDGLVAINDQAKITTASHRLLQLTGYSAEELIGRPVTMLFTEKSQQALKRSLQEDRQVTFSYWQEVMTKNKQTVPVLIYRIRVQHLVNREREESSLIIFSDLSELQRRQEALERQTSRLSTLNRAFQAIGSHLSLPEVIEIILTSAQEVMQGHVASLLLRDVVDDSNELIYVKTIGSNAERMTGRRVPIGMGVVGQVASTAQSRLIGDVSQEGEFLRGFDSDPELDVRSIVAVPLATSGEVIGVLEVINKKNGMFDQDDLTMLENLSVSAAVAIEKASLFEQTQRRLIEMTTLLDASAAVTSTLKWDAMLEQIARRLRDALTVQHVVIATRERNGRTLRVHGQVVNARWEKDDPSAYLLPLAEAPSMRDALQQNSPTTFALDKGELSSTEHNLLYLRGMRAGLNFPLPLASHQTAMLTLYHTNGQASFSAMQITAIADSLLSWQQNPAAPLENVEELCQRLLQASNSQWCTFYLLTAHRSHLQVIQEIGASHSEDRQGLIWQVEEYPTMQTSLQKNEPVLIWGDQIDDDKNEQTYLQQMGAGTCLMVPLMISGNPRGLLKLMTTDKRIFEDNEISLCQGIANVVVNALENSTLYSSLEQRAEALQAAYLELEEADRIKDDMLQNLSHELSTPLMHALGYLNLLRDRAFGDLNRDQIEHLDLITQKTQTVSDLVKNMVAVHSGGTQRLEIKSARLEQVAALTVRSFSAKAKNANITIIPRIQPNLPPALIDRARIGEVFEALIDNAIKFSPNSNRIEIGIEDPDGPMLQVFVRDEGIGIPPEEHEKVFRRFYQVDSSTTRRFGGTGLGLAIVHNIITGHGGKVWVESEVGKGTTIFFTVPKASFHEDTPSGQNNVFA